MLGEVLGPLVTRSNPPVLFDPIHVDRAGECKDRTCSGLCKGCRPLIEEGATREGNAFDRSINLLIAYRGSLVGSTSL